jgi:hypothetical protein
MIQQPVYSHQGRGRRLGPLIGVVVVVILLVVVIGGFVAVGAAIATGDRLEADAAISQAGKDANQISDPLSKVPDVPFSNSAQDLANYKTTLDGYVTKFKQADGLVNSDLPKLRSVSDKLRGEAGNPIVAVQRGSLDQERSRVDSVVAAFSAAGQYLKISEDQVTFFAAFVDATGSLAALRPYEDRRDYAGALAQFSGIDSKVQQAVALSKGTSTPPQFQSPTNGVATMAADRKKYLQALQARDTKTANAMQTKLDADATALTNFDQQGFTKYEDQLFKPLQDRWANSLRQAGFQIT